MVLFKKQFIDKIRRGEKTQTRRIWTKSRVKIGNVYPCQTSYFSEPFARIKVTGLWQERLGHISGRDVKAEGFNALAEFIDAWKVINGSYDPNTMVYVVQFEVVYP